MIKFNYILNDLALSSLITKCLYSENANYSDKEELENQIKLIQQENEQLQQENKQLKDELKSNPDTQITLQDDKGNKFMVIQTEIE